MIKLHAVFDGSVKTSPNSLSSNNHFEIRPKSVQSPYDLIIEFCSHSIVLTADIEKVFLEISIRKLDLDYLRFYCFNDITSSNPTIVKYRY